MIRNYLYRIRKLFCSTFLVSVLSSSYPASASLFGEETAVLLDVVSNQLTELEKLADSVGVAKNQRDLLLQINDGINKTTQQIRSIQDIIERSQGIDPTSIRSLSELNQTIDNYKYVTGEIRELVIFKLTLCDQAIEEASMQGDTTYKMGQEMEDLGAQLAEESKTASPGRAQQITAAAASAQMLAMGVELQTLSHMSQLLAMNLDLQKTQIQKELKLEQTRKVYLKNALTGGRDGFSQDVARLNQPGKKGKAPK